MDDIPTYDELAQELLDELGAIGRAVGPKALNATRGETAALTALFRAETCLSPTQIGSLAHVSSARVANILRALEEKGLVTRTHAGADRRAVAVELTDAGRERAGQVRTERTHAVAGFLEALGTSDATELVRIVRRSRDILAEGAWREGAR